MAGRISYILAGGTPWVCCSFLCPMCAGLCHSVSQQSSQPAYPCTYRQGVGCAVEGQQGAGRAVGCHQPRPKGKFGASGSLGAVHHGAELQGRAGSLLVSLVRAFHKAHPEWQRGAAQAARRSAVAKLPRYERNQFRCTHRRQQGRSRLWPGKLGAVIRRIGCVPVA